jgi:Fe-S-cluster containining protein
MKHTTNLKSGCSTDCKSQCCYLTKPGLTVELSDIKRIEDGINANPGLLQPEYRDTVMKLVHGNAHRKTLPLFGEYIRCNLEKFGWESGMQPYYPCLFLSDGDAEGKSRECMIYNLRPDICRNTTEKDCMATI